MDHVRLDSGTGLATVVWAPGATPDPEAVRRAVERAGYSAESEPNQRTGSVTTRAHGWRLNLVIGIPVTTALAIGEWVLSLDHAPWFRWTALILASLVQFGAGTRFYTGAWRQLKHGRTNMDALVALGSTTAYIYSVWVLLAGTDTHLYFMEAAAIITLISLGHWIETTLAARASNTIQALMELAPQTAHLLQPAPSAILSKTTSSNSSPDVVEIVEVPVTALKPGDLVLLRPGERIPTDGVVADGSATVDESMLTGESRPVDKSRGDRLYAGTLNLDGQLVMEVMATGSETVLAQIIAIVQRAQTTRANIQRLADKISNVFVPVVVAVASATFLGWWLAPTYALRVHYALAQFLWHTSLPESPAAAALICAAAVLIVACPCAMGLATPAAIMAAVNAAARRGILIRDAIALEKAGSITTVMLDKTGTVTLGQPRVVATLNLLSHRHALACAHPSHAPTSQAQQDATTLLAIASALARCSTHPISQAIAELSKTALPVTDLREIRGYGLQGQIEIPEAKPGHGTARNNAHFVRLGAFNWLASCGVDITPAAEFISKWTAQGATVVGCAINNNLAGAFALADQPKPSARAVIAALQAARLKVCLVTGDNRNAALAVAKTVGIPPEHVYSELTPTQKAELVAQAQEAGERLAFVGDGINDSPALACAELGIAVGRASDIARQTADIVLLSTEIDVIPSVLALAGATRRIIKQNLFWALVYNLTAVPLAATGFLSPVICAMAMGLSDLFVIGNALRLLRYGRANPPRE